MKQSGYALVLAPLCMASLVNAQAQSGPDTTLPVQPQLVVASTPPPVSHAGALVLRKDTMVRLMVLNEVNTHRAKVGDRFVLRVDENVAVDGTTVIPVGAKAWGEVTQVKENAALGQSGKLGARLLYVEVGDTHIPVSGEEQSKGNAGGDRVAMAVLGFGLLGLLARGTQGKLKAGAIFNGYVGNDIVFDPATSTFLEAEAVLPAEPESLIVSASPQPPALPASPQ